MFKVMIAAFTHSIPLSQCGIPSRRTRPAEVPSTDATEDVEERREPVHYTCTTFVLLMLGLIYDCVSDAGILAVASINSL